jgi:hypothetical protein
MQMSQAFESAFKDSRPAERGKETLCLARRSRSRHARRSEAEPR